MIDSRMQMFGWADGLADDGPRERLAGCVGSTRFVGVAGQS